MSSAREYDPVTQLRQALAQDAFALYCQPIGSLSGPVMNYPIAEVLVRLWEEENAMLPPGEFLPVLEHYGLMPEFDRWVVQRVLRLLASGSRIGRLSINLSAQTLADRAFPLFLADALIAEGVPGNSLLFEIEEADAMAAPHCTTRFAALTGSLGTGIVIDGFGRTEESFFLLDLPCVQLVKLHGALTRRLLVELDPPPALVHAIEASSAHGVRLVADGVEEPQLFRRLRRLGIDYVQGFGVYKPRPIEDFVEPPLLQVA